MTAPVTWLAPWYGVDDEAERRGLEAELRREICDAHVLAGEPLTLLARRYDMDEALYLIAGGRVAEVHLTWSSERETDPRWPSTAIYASLEEWRERSMLPTHTWLRENDAG